MSDSAPAQVVTFYSYKGGTGRSQALANVAWILASNRRRVLVIDWDLEAPGLHRYFAPFLFDASLAESDGLIEFVLEYSTKALTRSPDRADDGNWYKRLADISRFAISVDYAFDGEGAIDLVPAGRQDAFYAERVRSFDWHNFYDRLRGGAFLEETRNQIIESYHYILIDSRTGVSDTSGICTVQLPDVVVACFTANNQSIDGTAAVAASVCQQERLRGPVRLLPLLTRVDTSEKHKLKRRKELARAEFDELLPADWALDRREEYWGAAQVPYIPFYAYEEVLAPFDDQPGDAASMLTAMVSLTSAITGGELSRLGDRPTREKCLEIQTKYSRHKKLPPSTSDSATLEAIYDIYVSFGARDRKLVRPIVERLRKDGVRFYYDEWHLLPGQNWRDEAQKALDASPACVVFIGDELGTWQTQEVLGFVSERLAKSRGRFRVIPALLAGSEHSRLPEFLRDITSVDFNGDQDEAFGHLLDAIRGVASSPAPSADECPYKGLEFFDSKDARVFFGRESLTAEILDRLRVILAMRGARRTVGIVGPPGSGKSSVARAGLIDALRRGKLEGSAQWPIVIFKPGLDPLESLTIALSTIPELSLSQNPTRLGEMIRAMLLGKDALHLALRIALANSPSDRRVIVLVDQAEEVFTLCRDSARRDAFLENLAYATQVESGNTTVAFTARDDIHLDDLALIAIAGPIESLFQTAFLSRDELRRAIEEPAKLVGLAVEPALVNLLLQEVYQQPGGLWLLQAALVSLWQRREDRTLTAQAYATIGGVQGILFGLAEDAYARLDPSDQQIFRDVLLSLSASGNPGRLALVSLRSPGASSDQVSAVVRAMVDRRVLTTESGGPNDPNVMPAHESLLLAWPKLLGWKKDLETAQASRDQRSHRASVEVTFDTIEVKPALVVYAVWHPRWNEGVTYANQIYSRFARDVNDPLSRGIGIPVYFRSEPTTPAAMTPTPIRMNDARRTAVVAFVSSHMAVDEAWMTYLRALVEEARGSDNQHRVLLVAVSPAVWRSDSVLSRMIFIRLYDFRGEKTARLLGILAQELGRLLWGAPGASQKEQRSRLFLSHALQDGMRLADAITAHARQERNLDVVADEVAYGDWQEWVEESLSDAIFLALRTDSYASRQWCRSEVLAAKRSEIPMVVVDALERVEPRAFPYLGNIPSIRWTGTNAEEVVDLAIQEWLRLLHARARFESLREIGRIPANSRLLCRPPELLDCHGNDALEAADGGRETVVVYPDPPLGEQELVVLSRFWPGVTFVTPTGAEPLGSPPRPPYWALAFPTGGPEPEWPWFAPPGRCPGRAGPLPTRSGCVPCLRRRLAQGWHYRAARGRHANPSWAHGPRSTQDRQLFGLAHLPRSRPGESRRLGRRRRLSTNPASERPHYGNGARSHAAAPSHSRGSFRSPLYPSPLSHGDARADDCLVRRRARARWKTSGLRWEIPGNCRGGLLGPPLRQAALSPGWLRGQCPSSHRGPP